MRRFLVAFDRARTAPPIPLDDLPSRGGRMDLVARVVASSFLVSHGVRHDVELSMCLLGPPRPPLAFRLTGARLRNVYPDERSIASWLLRGFEAPCVPGEWLPAGEGFEVRRDGPAELLEGQRESRIVVLDEYGAPMEKFEPTERDLFVLGDDRGVPAAVEHAIRALPVERVCVGPVSIQTDQCIAVLHNRLDRGA